jgi:hypothetical protein
MDVQATPAVQRSLLHRRPWDTILIGAGVFGLFMAWLGMNFIFAANERESVDSPPHHVDLFLGIAAVIAGLPSLVWAGARGPKSARVLALIGSLLAAFAMFWALAIVKSPPW